MNVSDETGSHQDSTQCVRIRKVGERPVSEKNYDLCYELVEFLHSKGILVINVAYISFVRAEKIARQNSGFCDAQLINGVTK